MPVLDGKKLYEQEQRLKNGFSVRKIRSLFVILYFPSAYSGFFRPFEHQLGFFQADFGVGRNGFCYKAVSAYYALLADDSLTAENR